MGDKQDQILSAIAAVQTTVTATEKSVSSLEKEMVAVRIQSAVQENRLDTLGADIEDARSKIGKAFKSIDAHVSGHMVYYTGTIGIVVGILAVAKYISG